LIVVRSQKHDLDLVLQYHRQTLLIRRPDRRGRILEFEQLPCCGILEPLQVRLNDRARGYRIQRAKVDTAHCEHGHLLISAIRTRKDWTALLRRLRHDADEAKGPLAPRDRFTVVRRPDVTLSDEAGDEVCGDNAALRVGREKDGVGATEIVDPCRIREVGLV